MPKAPPPKRPKSMTEVIIPNEKEFLTIIVDPQKLQEKYKATKKTGSFLIYADIGIGKTSVLKTCRFPLLVDSFDPGGTVVLQKEIERGDIIVDTRYEIGTGTNFSTYNFWWKNHQARKAAGTYEKFKSYSIDSSTLWGQAALQWAILQAPDVARSGDIPCQGDYGALLTSMGNVIRDIMSLPCDVIFLNHIHRKTEEILGTVLTSSEILFPGQSKDLLPMYFSEFYYLDVKPGTEERRFLTQPGKGYLCRSRLSSLAPKPFEKHEPANICGILKKAGYDV